MSHRCPAPGCTVEVSDTRLMCKTHWRQVPFYVRTEVTRTYARGVGVGSAAHTSAIRHAMRSLLTPLVCAFCSETRPEDALGIAEKSVPLSGSSGSSPKELPYFKSYCADRAACIAAAQAWSKREEVPASA